MQVSPRTPIEPKTETGKRKGDVRNSARGVICQWQRCPGSWVAYIFKVPATNRQGELCSRHSPPMRAQSLLVLFATVAAVAAQVEVERGAPAWREVEVERGAPTWREVEVEVRPRLPVRSNPFECFDVQRGAPTWREVEVEARPRFSPRSKPSECFDVQRGAPAWKRVADIESDAAPPWKRSESRAERAKARAVIPTGDAPPW
ncbi:hypothetical protein DFH07DRAFT_272327 [Mycena maculata]|uniref:Uncharacterized protein n=1 Tax=Mycena maculata TaxID=230809 RepID=A0AAD7JU26_9AGAR|nr:hypothetical protein DFH07DRAFT_272327 [Mycena maculata]